MATRPPRRLLRQKYLMQEAGREARDLLMFRKPSDPRALLLLAPALARAVWRQDAVTADRLLASHAAAADFVRIEGDRVSFIHPAAFQSWTNRVQLEAANLDRLATRARLERAVGEGVRQR
eukprot:1608548-Pyramimonas_sp.AAC.1